MWCIHLMILALSIASIPGSVFSSDCDTILGQNYTKKVIVDFGKTNIFGIVKSKKTGYIYIAEQNYRTYGHRLFVIKNEAHDPIEIDLNGIMMNSLAVNDAEQGKIFIGCEDGLKVYDERTEITKDLSGVTRSIWKLFVRKGFSEMFATTKPNGEVYKFNGPIFTEENLNITVSKALYGYFAVDSEGTYFYHNQDKETQLLLEGSSKPIKYEGNMIDILIADYKGRVYGTANHRLYHLNSNSNIPQFVSILGFEPHCMFFEENNSIIAGTLDGKVIRLEYDDKCISASTAALPDALNDLTVKFNELSKKVDEKLKELVEKNLILQRNITAYDNIIKDFMNLKLKRTENKSEISFNIGQVHNHLNFHNNNNSTSSISSNNSTSINRLW